MPRQSDKKEGFNIREKDLENHFQNGDESEGSAATDKKDKPLSTKPEDNLKNDYQVVRALDLLKGWDIFKKIGSSK